MSAINLRAPVFFLFFLLKIQPLMASIDGGPEFQANWDGNQWPVPPGQHRVAVWFKYFWFLPIGRAEMVVNVPPGGAIDLEYKHPWIVFLPGKLQVVAPRAVDHGQARHQGQPQGALAGGAPAGWQPDPSGRFEQRYWDGASWTEHVSTGGVASSDPLPG
jgi:hypothetical protein